MPIINFTNPLYVVVALVLVLLCAFLANQYKKNTIPCIVLLVFLAIVSIGITLTLSQNEPSFIFSELLKIDSYFFMSYEPSTRIVLMLFITAFARI